MIPRAIRSRVSWLAGVLLLLAVVAPLSDSHAGKKKKQAENEIFVGWYEGAAGYREALAIHEESGKPLVVYFQAPWCSYCRTVNTQLLATPTVHATLGEMLAVRVYGGAGSAEQKLMDEFGTEIYPTLYIRRAKGETFERLELFTDGRVRAPEAVVTDLRAAPPAS